jgi:hypothetical protein
VQSVQQTLILPFSPSKYRFLLAQKGRLKWYKQYEGVGIKQNSAIAILAGKIQLLDLKRIIQKMF